MKYVDEYREPATAAALAETIKRTVTRPWTIMEVCGGQTHSIVRFGLDALLPAKLTLVHGPGCPVCVTPIGLIDQALQLASLPRVIFCSFGDMLRVPGSQGNLFDVKAAGGDVRIIYSPLDALELARENPDREIVCFAVGFETTAPAYAMAAIQARRLGLTNFSLLAAHVLVPPAMEAILSAPGSLVQGFLAAGHVCTIMGYEEYEDLARRYRVPIVVTGFEPIDILEGIAMLLCQLEEGRAIVENQYVRSVRREGNVSAQAVVREVFEPTLRAWRGIGDIPHSGLKLTSAYANFDAAMRFREALSQAGPVGGEDPDCQSGLVLQGLLKPPDCPAFATRCTPEKPLGAPMVSSEGACAAYYRYRRRSGSEC
ncbi:MAG: hydrogenase formation protein HypD [Nitrospirota bacterium]|nr:hydrogenase formation protein HypD [Nitrospirota bacterium]MDP2381505.1 hydrogenase formation protein HypD [Nitrospirota bacterium]MDP3597378.1 hydrogenase formation protein HypD [Nitrospirota bacterium]